MQIESEDLSPNVWWIVRLMDPKMGDARLCLIRMAAALPVLDHSHLTWWAANVVLSAIRGEDYHPAIIDVLRRFVIHPYSVAAEDIATVLRLARKRFRLTRENLMRSVILWTHLIDLGSDAKASETTAGTCMWLVSDSAVDILGCYKAAVRYYQLAVGYQHERIGLIRRRRTRVDAPPPRRLPSLGMAEKPWTMESLGRYYLRKSLSQGWVAPEISIETHISRDKLRGIYDSEIESDEGIAEALSMCAKCIGPSIRTLPDRASLMGLKEVMLE